MTSATHTATYMSIYAVVLSKCYNYAFDSWWLLEICIDSWWNILVTGISRNMSVKYGSFESVGLDDGDLVLKLGRVIYWAVTAVPVTVSHCHGGDPSRRWHALTKSPNSGAFVLGTWAGKPLSRGGPWLPWPGAAEWWPLLNWIHAKDVRVIMSHFLATKLTHMFVTCFVQKFVDVYKGMSVVWVSVYFKLKWLMIALVINALMYLS